MKKSKLSLDKDTGKEIEKFQEKLKANNLRTSFQNYRKKIQSSKYTNKNYSSTPSTSSDSLFSVHSNKEIQIRNSEDNKLKNKEKLCKSNSQGLIERSNKYKQLKENVVFNNNNFNSKNHVKNSSNSKDNLKQKVVNIKNLPNFKKCSEPKIFTNSNHESRQRSISERCSYTTSLQNITKKTKNGNVRTRSLSSNISSAKSKNLPQIAELKRCEKKERKDAINENGNGTNNKKKNSRGKRGSKFKTKATQANAEHIPYYAKECDNLYINAETLLILDLIFLPLDQHINYLFDLAKAKKIIVSNSDNTGYIYNPRLKRCNSILQLGNQCRYLNPDDLILLQNMMKNTEPITRKRAGERRRRETDSKRDRKYKCFEDYVNDIVGEYLPENEREKYLLKKLKKKNNFSEKEYENELENYAQKLVDANLGIIVESDVRINGKNNEQSFIRNVNGKRDAFISSTLGRKYSLHGDIVKVFICNEDNEKQSSKNVDDIGQNNAEIRVENAQNMDLNNKNSATSNDRRQAGPSKDFKDLINDKDFCLSDSNIKDTNDEFGELNTSNDIKDKNDEFDELNISNDILSEHENEPVLEKSSKAFVIKIIKHVHNRKCVGSFLSFRKDTEYITFVPRDLKMPNIRIYKNDWPKEFEKANYEGITEVLYVAQIVDWQNGVCIGKILQPIGKCGKLESENKAILLQNGLEMDPYEEKYNEMFYGPIIITDKDLKEREDLRSECIFTIDPLTARDLDDALSCKTLEDGTYEIGVHISDVAYFLEEKSEIDEIVSTRATSVYMVNEVFHMLPKPLCFKCSLLPGEDKFAFSCIWNINRDGEILNTRMCRTIINSCTQFAYEHAQKIIDKTKQNFVEDDFPQIHNNWTVNDILERIDILHSIANIWRNKRFDNGALKISRPKLYFRLEGETGEPAEFFQALLQPANFLIEEYMLRANQSVAEFIYQKFPKISFLRNHKPPLNNPIQKLLRKLKDLGLHLDITSSKTIYETYTKLIQNSENPQTLEVCLTHLISKPMSRAEYFCSENATDSKELWHYSLSIPIYTHFTSPIRRYPDILVHRVLAAALEYSEPPQRTPEELHIIAAICNEKKYTAKLAGEDSSNLYFMYYIKSKNFVLMKAAMLEFFSRSMEVVLIESGHQIRVVYPTDKSNIKIIYNNNKNSATLIKEDPDETIQLKPFGEIELEIYVEKFKIKARIPGTSKKQKNSKSKRDECNNRKDKCTSISNEQIKSEKTKSIVMEQSKNEDPTSVAIEQVKIEENRISNITTSKNDDNSATLKYPDSDNIENKNSKTSSKKKRTNSLRKIDYVSIIPEDELHLITTSKIVNKSESKKVIIKSNPSFDKNNLKPSANNKADWVKKNN